MALGRLGLASVRAVHLSLNPSNACTGPSCVVIAAVECVPPGTPPCQADQQNNIGKRAQTAGAGLWLG